MLPCFYLMPSSTKCRKHFFIVNILIPYIFGDFNLRKMMLFQESKQMKWWCKNILVNAPNPCSRMHKKKIFLKIREIPTREINSILFYIEITILQICGSMFLNCTVHDLTLPLGHRTNNEFLSLQRKWWIIPGFLWGIFFLKNWCKKSSRMLDMRPKSFLK